MAQSSLDFFCLIDKGFIFKWSMPMLNDDALERLVVRINV